MRTTFLITATGKLSAMIHVNELRIGNNVLFPADSATKKVESITGILHDHVLLSPNHQGIATPQPLNRIEPISLTPEILAGSGFTFMGDDWYEMKTLLGKINFNLKYKICSVSDADYINECMLNEGTVLYLHQLQNLCFLLTGKEIQVKFNIEPA